jgi:GTP-binding protein YchF
MQTAIIGLPMVGKTSLFTILTGVHESARVGAMEARLGVAKVPDDRVEALAEVFEPGKLTHATMEYLDFPSISMEALRDPKYLSGMRLAESLAHVIRVFASDTVPHEKGSVDPVRDLEEVEAELILSDLMVIEKRLERLAKDRLKIKDPDLDHEFDLLSRAKDLLDESTPLRAMELDPAEEKRVRGFGFLSRKPMLYVLNLGEEDAPRLHELEQDFRQRHVAGKPRTGVTAVCGKIEAELAELEPDEAEEYMASYGLPEGGLTRLVHAGYALLGLMSFLTAGETEIRAWTIPVGSTALEAAGAIHTDFTKKFIRAEVADWKTLAEHGGYAGAREKGALRLEGKNYVVQNGDVLLIRHG